MARLRSKVFATFILFSALMIGYLGAFVPAGEAGPAAPNTFKAFEQPDGTLWVFRLWGDEFANGWETLQGYTVIQNEATGYWEYAVQDEAGHLVPSGVVLGLGDPPAPPHARPSQEVIEQARQDLGVPPNGSVPHNSAPPWASGNTNILVIMVEFPADLADPDGAQPAVNCTFDATQMQANLFGGAASGPGDMTDYYDEISDGDINLIGTVVGCYTVANDKNDYDDGPSSAAALVQEAISLADPDVDFSNFDNDNNGVVDMVAVTYAGGGPDNGCYSGATGATDNLWPHAASIGAVNVDGKTLSSYFISPELLCGSTIRTIGVYAHEFGHKLGLPDLYDTDNSSEGIGHWGLMGTGSWTSTTPGVESGSAPSHMTPWSKWFLEWVTPTDLTGANTTIELDQVETSGEVIQLLNNPAGPDDWVGSGEYFLIENRQQTLFDIGLDGCGVLIWHMDESLSHNKNEGHTAGSHRLVDLEEADGNDDLDKTPPASNRGDAGDPFPGTSSNTLFTDTTTPHAKRYNGSNTDIRVEIVSTTCGSSMTLNFGVMPTADAGGPYFTPEGTDVVLNGSGSSHPTDAIVSYEWDLDNDGMYDDATGISPTFTMVGQDGVFTIGLKVTTDGGAVDTDTAMVTVTNVAPTVDLDPVPDADEGSTITLNGVVSDPGWLDPLTATVDWGDGTSEPVVGVLENVDPDATLTFSMNHAYGDNGTYEIEVCAADDDTSGNCASVMVDISNVAPSVSVTPVGPLNEGDLAEIMASFSDPGWLDTYTYTIDWGWGGFPPDAGVPAVTTEGPPMDIGQVSGDRQYGDNGVFTVMVTVTDDDGGSGSDSFELIVNNVPPTAEIDESGTVLINGTPTFLAHAGEPIDFSGRSTDPGSDDLFLSWDWDDGPPQPDVITEYLLDPPNPDPDPSPTVDPRDETDMQTHAFEDACIYEIVFAAEDDDGGSASDTANVLIVGNAGEVRTAGYWLHQYRGNGKIDFTAEELDCYLEIVRYVSLIFDEDRDLSTFEDAVSVLFVLGNKGSMEQIFDRQLLAAWLNFANGAVEWNQMIDTDGDGAPDTAFSDVMAAAEAVRLDPAHTREALEAQKDILERINEGQG